MKHDNAGRSLHASSPSSYSQIQVTLGVYHLCPAWMDNHEILLSSKDKENEDDLDEEDPVSDLFLWHARHQDHEVGSKEANDKEVPIEDQEELESGER